MYDDDEIENLDEIVDSGDPEHEPFAPPSDYQFEDEFQHPVPRPCPPEVRWGRYETLRRRRVSGLLIGGAACTALAKLQFVEILSNYILPLQFLLYIGLFLGACGVGLVVARKFWPGRYRYVIEGQPIIAQILSLEMKPVVDAQGNPTVFLLLAKLRYRNVDTGEEMVGTNASSSIGIGQRRVLRSTYRPGDYVTAVYLPRQPEKDLRLYGFLELRNDIGVVVREGMKLDSAVQIFASLIGLFGFLGGIGWLIYGFGVFSPISIADENVVTAFVSGALLIGVPFFALFHRLTFGKGKRGLEADPILEANERPNDPITLTPASAKSLLKMGWFLKLLIFLGFCLLGGMALYSACLSVNALLDGSPGVWKPISIEKMIVKTHRGVIRDYQVHYQFLDNPGMKHKRGCSPEEMVRLRAARIARAEVHAGYLGWPWVKSIAQ